MKRSVPLLLLIVPLLLVGIVGLSLPIATAQAPPDSTVAAPANPLGAATNILLALAPIVLALNGLGLVVKFVPLTWLAAIKNWLIPFLNAGVAFFAAFDGVAHAGIFGDVFGELTIGAKLVGSLAVSAISKGVHDTYIRPLEAKLGLVKNENLVGPPRRRR